MYSLDQITALWKNHQCTDVDYALFFFLDQHLKRYPHQRIQRMVQSQFTHLPFSDHILTQYPFKKVKKKALDALIQWRLDQWPILLVDHLVSPLDLLETQARGQRPVSLIYQQEPSPILHRKDSFDFFLHDLEHAFLFFSDLKSHQIQTQFFKKLWTSCQPSLDQSIWAPYIKDPVFQSKFIYLISDMNTHIEHYRAYLKAILPYHHFNRFQFLFESIS